jgi:hypothetical protein
MYWQCCRSAMFISELNFSIPDPGFKKAPDAGSTTKNLSILTQKFETKFSDI